MTTSGPRAPRVVAHRGLHAEQRGGARENTLASAQDAVAAGIDWVEIDVRVTRDGEVVVLHDDTLERLWGDPRRVVDLDVAEVLALGHGDQRVPTLAALLRAIASAQATVLVDVDDPAVAEPAAAVVAAMGDAVPVAWCGRPEAMAGVRAALPGARTWRAWYRSTPPPTEVLEETAVVNVEHRLVDGAFVTAAHRAGVEVAVWTVNDPDEAVRLAALGVDSITSDVAPLLRDALEAVGGGP